MTPRFRFEASRASPVQGAKAGVSKCRCEPAIGRANALNAAIVIGTLRAFHRHIVAECKNGASHGELTGLGQCKNRNAC
jgi:hypothetical protein